MVFVAIMSATSTNATSEVAMDCGTSESLPIPGNQSPGQVHNEPHQSPESSGSDQELSEWDQACLKYFKVKYRQRLEKVNWANGRAVRLRFSW